MTLHFYQVVIDGVSEAVNAVALDPNTTLPGVVTDIDRRYFSRIVLPRAAKFVEGLTEAISESGTTTVTIQGQSGTTTTSQAGSTGSRQEVASGIEEAGSALSDILSEEVSKIQPMLKIRAGTPIGIFFVDPVIEGKEIQPPLPPETTAAQPAFGGFPNFGTVVPMSSGGFPNFGTLVPMPSQGGFSNPGTGTP